MSNFNRGQGNRGYQGGGYGGYNNAPREVAREEDAMKLPADYVDKANLVMQELHRDGTKLTTSKIRRILSMVNDLHDAAKRRKEEELSDAMKSSIQYLRMRIAYESGRGPLVKTFAQKAHLIGYLKNIGNSREALLDYAAYMEALVAYHRFYGGND